ncbi:hypothetical protein TD95_002634 [Thielaviopsis punctulata]|uniref:UmuC domain-containing protein n=1 Tax=Thielaviopsis punctulata TaxID=72032 RepID=A0A0F4Z972_9PEZI|nr:hypothetical protein TD95_002634 [Thielaviopsis punctulata]
MATTKTLQHSNNDIKDRVILQFDYDCFYASVFEHLHPALKSKPVGVRQKGILATCNYVARARGVRKLSLLSDAMRACPDLVVCNGEDLTPFRDESKRLYSVLRGFSWSGKVEKLGLDEVFMDVTDIIDYNMSCLNLAHLHSAFFFLSCRDPELGFPCDLSQFAGCVTGATPSIALRHISAYATDPPAFATDPVVAASALRLLLGSHLAQYLRERLEDHGFTASCGVATNKVLSKMAAAKNKPRNQTTLLLLSAKDREAFMAGHTVRQIPGIGARTAGVLQDLVQSSEACTVAQVLRVPDMSPRLLDRVLSRSGSERDIGEKLWNLLHGIDETIVKNRTSVPSQISVEDSFRHLRGTQKIHAELRRLAAALVRRMRTDLLVIDAPEERDKSVHWAARPKTLRLSLRNMKKGESLADMYAHRVSRSQPVPGFLFNVKEEAEELAARLVDEALARLLTKFGIAEAEWDIAILNVGVSNMVVGASDSVDGSGRNIADMFKRQDEVLQPFRVTEGEGLGTEDTEDWDWEEHSGDERDAATVICPQCDHRFLAFALVAHLRYHQLEK